MGQDKGAAFARATGYSSSEKSIFPKNQPPSVAKSDQSKGISSNPVPCK
jgi:hypothetical protein